jgi:sugar phosphate isomerase/epimerase
MESEMAEKKIGLNLYSLREFTQTADGLKETLRKVGDMGYQGVQVSGIKEMEPEKIAEIVKDSGLPVAATHLGWDLFRDKTARAIEIHKLYDCPHSAIGSLPDEYRSSEGADRFLKELQPVIKELQDAGLDFSYHNHNHELARIGQKTWLASVLEKSADMGLCFEIDTYWIQAGGGDPWEWVKLCKGRMPLLHVKDMLVTHSREQRFAPLGEGNFSWDRILQAAADGGVEWYLVEQDSFFDGADPFEEVAISCRYLQKNL